jgi:hypothetical protein
MGPVFQFGIAISGKIWLNIKIILGGKIPWNS